MKDINDIVSQLSVKEIQQLQEKITEILSEKTRTYQVSFKVTFKADRIDDLADTESFESHVTDAFSFFNFQHVEGITDIDVTEL
jgi:hypothetical protein